MKLSLSRGMTINLGNYESTRFDVSIERDFDEDITATEAYSALAKAISILVADELANTKRGPKR